MRQWRTAIEKPPLPLEHCPMPSPDLFRQQVTEVLLVDFDLNLKDHRQNLDFLILAGLELVLLMVLLLVL